MATDSTFGAPPLGGGGTEGGPRGTSGVGGSGNGLCCPKVGL